MKRAGFIVLAATIIGWLVCARAVNSVVVESKEVLVGAQNVEIGVFIANDDSLLGMLLPLELRSVTPGSYVKDNFTFQVRPEGRVGNSPLGPGGGPDWPPANITYRRFADTAKPDCTTKPGHTYNYNLGAQQIDFVSPDAILYVAVSTGDPSIGEQRHLLPGADPPGTANASFYFRFDVTSIAGTFEIDTCCVLPGIHLAFFREGRYDDQYYPTVVAPGFVKGIVTIVAPSMEVDLLPRQCPNRIWTEQPDLVVAPAAVQPGHQILPAAILGSPSLNVADVDPNSVRLEGVAPHSISMADVATPVVHESGECECRTNGADGYNDLSLQFDQGAIMAALQPWNIGESKTLTLTAKKYDQTPLRGKDCLILVSGPQPVIISYRERRAQLCANTPNPFNASTVISFSVTDESKVRLEVFDILGRHVRTLADDVFSAGTHDIVWDATNSDGESVASGIYLYRLTAPDVSETKKMVLLR